MRNSDIQIIGTDLLQLFLVFALSALLPVPKLFSDSLSFLSASSFCLTLSQWRPLLSSLAPLPSQLALLGSSLSLLRPVRLTPPFFG